mgnify:CR=1 FL=1
MRCSYSRLFAVYAPASPLPPLSSLSSLSSLLTSSLSHYHPPSVHHLIIMTVPNIYPSACLRSWEVFWNRDGIVVTQIATLDTLSSHILSLSATTLINHDHPADAEMQHIYLNSPGKRTSPFPNNIKNDTHNRALTSGARSGGGGGRGVQLPPPHITYTQMVVASTNLGQSMHASPVMSSNSLALMDEMYTFLLN